MTSLLMDAKAVLGKETHGSSSPTPDSLSRLCLRGGIRLRKTKSRIRRSMMMMRGMNIPSSIFSSRLSATGNNEKMQRVNQFEI